jgi:hypothetical protein
MGQKPGEPIQTVCQAALGDSAVLAGANLVFLLIDVVKAQFDCIGHVTGIDLTPAMIAQAQARQLIGLGWGLVQADQGRRLAERREQEANAAALAEALYLTCR